MAQRLKVFAVLAENLGWVPITTLDRSSPSSDLLQQQQVHGYTYKHTHMPQIKIKFKNDNQKTGILS